MTSSVSAIVETAYPSRISAVEALRSPNTSGQDLRSSAADVHALAKRYGRVAGAKDWNALGLALETVAFLTDWAVAVDEAEPDADRHLRAARQRLKKFATDEEPGEYHAAVAECLASTAADLQPEEVAALRARLGAIAMPVSILADPEPEPGARFHEETRPGREDLAVAFLEFTINGSPAANLHALRPKEIHDLGLVIHVSRWPDGADALVISPISAEPKSAWDLPRFSFAKPDSDPPFTFQRNGRMVIHASQGFDARPLEFLYAAQFEPAVGDERLVIAGQRTLRLDGLGPEGQAISGYGELDAAILGVRRALRADASVPDQDIRSVMTILPTLANLAGASVQDALYPNPISESVFEADARDRLRAVPTIGAELEQQAHAAGGRTDLSFRGVRIELKSEQKNRLLPEDCGRFVEQTATYAVGTGKRVAILAVLDCSPKTTSPLPLGSCLFVQQHDTGAGIVQVVTVLIQGAFPKPSSFSR
jgi:hypothetical protein